MSEFSALLSAATACTYKGEVTPLLALCDYLEERGDERGARLRRRVAWYKNEASRWEPWLQDLDIAREEHAKGRLRHHRALLVDYLIRLTGSKPGSQLPAKRATNSGYPIIEPGAA